MINGNLYESGDKSSCSFHLAASSLLTVYGMDVAHNIEQRERTLGFAERVPKDAIAGILVCEEKSRGNNYYLLFCP